IFTGTAVWLEIGIRPAASQGAYTTLTPRQSLTTTPYAQYALDNPFWQASGTAITNKNSGFVGINRSNSIGSYEFFGIKAPVTNGFGGMYIDTNAQNTIPFYGYSVNNGADGAWTEYNGQTQDWSVYNGAKRLTAARNGFVGVGRTTRINSSEYFGIQ